MHNLALQNPDRQAGKAQHELRPSALGGVGPDISIVDKRQKIEIWFGGLANRQEPLQKPDERSQVVSGRHYRYQNGVRYQDRIAEHLAIPFSRISRRAVDEHYIIGLDRQRGFQKASYICRLQAQDFVRTAGTFSSSTPRESTRLATVGIDDQRTIPSSHECTRQIGSGRGFSAPTLLVSNRYDRRHAPQPTSPGARVE